MYTCTVYNVYFVCILIKRRQHSDSMMHGASLWMHCGPRVWRVTPRGPATHLCLLFSSRSAAVATLCRVSLEATTRCTTVSTSGTCSASMNFTMPSLHCREHTEVNLCVNIITSTSDRWEGGAAYLLQLLSAPLGLSDHPLGSVDAHAWGRLGETLARGCRSHCTALGGGGTGSGGGFVQHKPAGKKKMIGLPSKVLNMN